MTYPLRVGFAMTGSFCTFSRVLQVLETMARSEQYKITPILSHHAAQMDTRFGTADTLCSRLTELSDAPIIQTIEDAEPIGPQGLFDVLVVAPCTGNTLAKLAHSIIDTPVTMAVKSHLRRDRPVVIAVSTNDGLSGSASNLGILLNRRHYFFVPFGQDAPCAKPRSLVANMESIPQTVDAAFKGEQLQPILALK